MENSALRPTMAGGTREWPGLAWLTWYIVGGSDLIVNYKLHKVTISISDIPDVFVALAVCCYN